MANLPKARISGLWQRCTRCLHDEMQTKMYLLADGLLVRLCDTCKQALANVGILYKPVKLKTKGGDK